MIRDSLLKPSEGTKKIRGFKKFIVSFVHKVVSVAGVLQIVSLSDYE